MTRSDWVVVARLIGGLVIYFAAAWFATTDHPWTCVPLTGLAMVLINAAYRLMDRG